MGRKNDMKKIEDVTRCQVTFSKRRSSLMRKANEVAVCCDVDVAFVAFSPSGRISNFCNQTRIEDVLHRYVDLPAEKRLDHISNVQEKMEKLRQLGHIKGDTSKLQYLDKKIENLELRIKKSGLELQILENDLRDYEVGPEQEPSLYQLSWCERNLNHSLEKVIARKVSMSNKQSDFRDSNHPDQMELESRARKPFSSNFDEKGQTFTGQILMQLDPWISSYSARVRESIFEDLFDQTKYTTNEKLGTSNIPNFPIPSNYMCNFPILDSNIPIEQSLIVDRPLLDFHQQNNVDAWKNNTSSITFSDGIYMSSQSSCNIQGRRFTSMTSTVTTNSSRVETPQSLYDEMGITGLQCSNLNSSQLSNMEGHEIGQLNMDYCNNIFNNIGKTRIDNVGDEDCCRILNCNETQSQAPFYVPRLKEVFQDTKFDNFLAEDTPGDDNVSTSEVQKSSLWEWEDLLLDENFNLQ